jgi:orotate phosphoribosyltransferase
MSKLDVLRLLANTGAVVTNSHIVYTSGKHGSAYINKDAVYPHTQETYELCRMLALNFWDVSASNRSPEVVIAPAVGAIILSQGVGYHLTRMNYAHCYSHEVVSIYAEKVDGGESFAIQRGYGKFVAGKQVLVVEDVLTTGGSAKKVVEAVRRAEGNVIGVGVLCNRGGVTALDVGNVPKLHALANVTLEAWDESDCPLCKQDVPINTEVGKGREFLARKR